MYVEPEVKERMDKLSIAVWGSKSRWLNYLKYGIPESSKEVHPRTGRPKSTSVNYYNIDSLEVLANVLLIKMQESLKKTI